MPSAVVPQFILHIVISMYLYVHIVSFLIQMQCIFATCMFVNNREQKRKAMISSISKVIPQRRSFEMEPKIGVYYYRRSLDMPHANHLMRFRMDPISISS